MREIKDITKAEFLKAFNTLRFFRDKSVDLKELAGALDIFPGDLKKHIRNKGRITIGIYGYMLNKDGSRINRYKIWQPENPGAGEHKGAK